MGKGLGGGARVEFADPNWPRGYPMLCNVVLRGHNIRGRSGVGLASQQLLFGDWLGIGLLVGGGE